MNATEDRINWSAIMLLATRLGLFFILLEHRSPLHHLLASQRKSRLALRSI
jgi:hypothetical protein